MPGYIDVTNCQLPYSGLKLSLFEAVTMAEMREESPSSSQSLSCPLCLDIFEDATLLTCGHTFCRKCLKKYDASHQELVHMVCPLCREITEFSDRRVEGLPANVTVNGLVDDYHSTRGGENAFLEFRPKCTVCKRNEGAESFCSTCNTYMCEKCSISHEQLSLFFEGHLVTSVDDVLSGKVCLDHMTEKCLVHKHENKDLFCEECKLQICLKCVIVEHRDHKIKNQSDFEKQLQRKVYELTQRCGEKKTELEKNIQNIEIRRQEVHSAVQKLQSEVSEAYRKKASQLKENERILKEEIKSLQREFDKELDALKAQDRQKIKSITSTASLVTNDRLGRLETDSFAAHSLLCEELGGLLKENVDKTSAEGISQTARLKRFIPADDDVLDLGKVAHDGPADHGKVANDDLLDLGEIAASNRCLRIVKDVDLPCSTIGIAKKSEDSVAVALFNCNCVDIINCIGIRVPLASLPSLSYRDIAFQGNGNMVTSRDSYTEIHTRDAHGSKLSTFNIPRSSGYYPVLNVGPSNEIVVSNGRKEIWIYDPSGTVLKHTVPTAKNVSSQAFVTRSGVIVSGSCELDSPSVLTVYDMDGRAGSSLIGNPGEYLYAAADDQDRIYVAAVNYDTDTVSITLYTLDGLNLIEKHRFEELKLCIEDDWCYLVSLSRNMLAFASHTKLYFIGV